MKCASTIILLELGKIKSDIFYQYYHTLLIKSTLICSILCGSQGPKDYFLVVREEVNKRWLILTAGTLKVFAVVKVMHTYFHSFLKCPFYICIHYVRLGADFMKLLL